MNGSISCRCPDTIRATASMQLRYRKKMEEKQGLGTGIRELKTRWGRWRARLVDDDFEGGAPARVRVERSDGTLVELVCEPLPPQNQRQHPTQPADFNRRSGGSDPSWLSFSSASASCSGCIATHFQKSLHRFRILA
eukprot:3256320-Rhodomonas_salina.7